MTSAAAGSRPARAPELPQGSLLPGFTSLQHQLLPDPDSVVAAMARQASLRAFQPLVPRGEFYQLLGHLAIDELLLSSYVSAPVRFNVEHAPVIHLVCTFSGHRQVITPHGEVSASAGEAMLLPTGFRQASGGQSGAIVALSPERINRTAAVMAGPPTGRRSGVRRDGVFAPLSLNRGQARMLHALMGHIDACAAVDPVLPARLGLADVIHRQVAAIVNPGLLQEEPADQQRLHGRGGGSSFDALIDYIRTNLDQPLALSDLEARSFYSRRALQYAFRQKLNATPRQWIREQRLAQALERLEADGAQSIQAVALACGYRHMGLFSADFKRRFGVSPSQVRRGRL